MEVDRILSRNDVGDGGAGGGRFFGSCLGGRSFGRHGCCKFPGRSGVRCEGVEELIDIVVFNGVDGYSTLSPAFGLRGLKIFGVAVRNFA